MPDVDNGANAPDEQAQSAAPATQDSAALATPANLPLRAPAPGAQPLTPQPQPTAPDQQQPASPADATNARHSILGRVAERLFSGQHTEYAVDPKTGTTVPTVVKDPPGTIFRHLVAGMILGGMSQGRVLPPTGQEMDQQRFARAQTQFENQQKVRKENTADTKIANEATRAQAQQHMWNMSEISREHTASQRGMELLQKENALSLRKLEADEKAGGLAAPLKDNDKPANGAAMQKLFTEHPEEFQPPTGYALSVTKEYDLSGLKYDFKNNGWEDENHNAANISDHTTWHVRYIPNKAASTNMTYTGRELNQFFPDIYAGRLDPEKSYNLTHKDFTAVAEKQASLEHVDFQDNFRKTHEQVANVIRDGRNRLSTLHAQYAAATRSFDDQKASEIQGEIDSLNDEINEKIQTADPGLRQHAKAFYNLPQEATAPGAPQQTLPNAPVAPGRPAPKASAQPVAHKVGDVLTLKNGQRVRVTAVSPNGKYSGVPAQ